MMIKSPVPKEVVRGSSRASRRKGGGIRIGDGKGRAWDPQREKKIKYNLQCSALLGGGGLRGEAA